MSRRRFAWRPRCFQARSTAKGFFSSLNLPSGTYGGQLTLTTLSSGTQYGTSDLFLISAATNFRKNRDRETMMMMSRTTRPGQFIRMYLQGTVQSNVAGVLSAGRRARTATQIAETALSTAFRPPPQDLRAASKSKIKQEEQVVRTDTGSPNQAGIYFSGTIYEARFISGHGAHFIIHIAP